MILILQLHQRDIDSFGTVDNPKPPSCLVSVYSTNSTDIVLHYGIPLEGINPPTTVYIHRAPRTIERSREGNIVLIIILLCAAIIGTANSLAFTGSRARAMPEGIL